MNFHVSSSSRRDFSAPLLLPRARSRHNFSTSSKVNPLVSGTNMSTKTTAATAITANIAKVKPVPTASATERKL
ncbi:hypothetical protein HanHA300_Chr14g0518961 [Helianthus annuus]|nr:hypothetical protein HanHA300_Chr14g0518961 [Helianthus annuus]KAJ0485228.1 hypothetical protein HanHA89_Chr14g0565911 [Helianthus annuus]KAJ0655778.1 hypothetical protein HanLR1_Chr14g0528251 [Helianthus annuus]KAJ0659461.1 hypothetical protein HanOQP8_Chr14g0526421 [Helianthus annuus]